MRYTTIENIGGVAYRQRFTMNHGTLSHAMRYAERHYGCTILVNGYVMPNIEKDETFFYASVEAAEKDKVWCEEAHAFVTMQFKSAIDGGCVDLDDLNTEFADFGGWEGFVLDNIYKDMFDYVPVTGSSDVAIVKDADVAEICISRGMNVKKTSADTWEVSDSEPIPLSFGEEEDFSEDIGWEVIEPEANVLEPLFRATWDRYEGIGHLELGVPASKYAGGWKLKAHAEVYNLKDLEDYIRILRADPDELEIVDGEVVLRSIDKKTHLIEVAKSQGWYLNPETTDLIEDDCLSYEVGDPDDVTGYTVVVDPYNGLSQRKGHGPGCFWTAWE